MEATDPLNGRSLTTKLAAVIGCLLSASGLHATAWYVPGVANASGKNNTHFSSDVRILNRGRAPILASFELVPMGGDAPHAVSRAIAPGETFVSVNVLASLWGYSGAGTLKVTVDQSVAITARTYNDADPTGTYGTALTPLTDDDLVEAGDTAHAAWVSESADGTRDYRTNLAVFLPLPGSSVDVVLLDAAGQEKGRTNVSGGPLMYQAAASALVPGGLPVGRAEFRVLAGKAAAYVPVVDNVTGDGISVPAALPALEETRTVLNGAARAAGREGTYFRTDVRLFNLSEAAATVTVTPLSVPNVTTPASVTLAAGELREIVDVLGSLLDAPEGSTGSLLFVSSEPVVVLGRTSNVRRDGSPGTYGALEMGRSEKVFLSQGSDAVLIGLRQSSERPGYRSNVGFLAGSDGTRLHLSLRSRTGDLLGTSDTISLGSYAWSQPGLDSLFPGVPIPDDSVLEVVPRAGRVDVYASVIDNATGDPVITPAEDLRPYSCLLPEIVSFTAAPDTLASAGNVTLTWATSGADSLSGVSGAATPDGSVTVPVSASGAFRLQAANSCGTASATASVVVGPPTVQPVSPASGSPGELVTLVLGNVAVPSSSGSVLLTFPDGIAFRTQARGTEGSSQVRFIVPFLQDALAPSGYRQGPCTITVDAFGPVSNAVPFTITPLVPSGDPVAGFTAFLDSSFGAMQSALTGAEEVSDLQPGFATIRSAVHAYEALLLKVAADLAAAESTVTPVDLATEEVPSPETVTVTRADLGLVVALWRNVQASAAQLTPSALACAGASPCLGLRYPPLGACLALKALDVDDIVLDFFVGLVDVLGIRDDGTIVHLLANGVSMLLTSYISALETAKGACPAMPVWLKNFVADPDRVSVGDTQAVKVKAYMEFLVTSDNLATYLADQFRQRVLRKFASALPEALRDRWVEAATGVLRNQTASIRNTISSWVKAHGGIKALWYADQVGSCDLDLGRTRLYPRSYADFDPSYPQGEDDFYIEGHRRGNAVLFVVPKPRHFLLPVAVERAYANPAPAFSVPNYTLPMRVGGTSGFSVSGIQLGLFTAQGQVGSYSSPVPRVAVTRKMPFKFTAPGAFAGSLIQARTNDDLTFSVTVSGLAAQPLATYTTFGYSFLFESPRGSLSLGGALGEAYLTVTRSVDGAGASPLVSNVWSQAVSASDSFTARSSYQVTSSQRLIDGANGVGFASLLYVFRPVRKGSSGGGSAWSGNGPTGGVVTALSADPSTSASLGSASRAASAGSLLVATNGGGVHLSGNGGDIWQPATSGPSDPAVLTLSRDPRNASTVYAGTKTGGVFRSTDGGDTWVSLGLSGVLTNGVAPDPLDSSVLYALQYRTVGGLQKSLDGGSTWSARGNGLPASTIPSGLAFAPGSASSLFLATSKGLFASSDAAATFTAIGAASVGSCASQVIAVPSTPFPLLATTCAGGLWRSRDAGATWHSLAGCSSATGSLTVQPDGTVLSSSTSAVCRSTDAGSTWSAFPTGTTDPVSGAALSPDGALFALTPTGLLRSRDGGATFAPANAGLAASWVSQVLPDRRDATVLHAVGASSTTSGCGRPFRSTDGGGSWTRVDAALAAVPTVCRMAQDPASGVLYLAGQSNGTPKAARSADGGATWQEMTIPLVPYSGESSFRDVFVGAAAASPVYVASDTHLYVSTTGGASWSTAGPWPNVNWVVFPLAPDPKDPDDIICPIGAYGLYRTRDGGRSWTPLPGPSDLSSTTQVAFDQADTALIYAATSHGVYRSTDGGGSWAQTTQTAGMASVATDPSSSGTVYAGRGYSTSGGGGVFRSTDRGETWTQVGSGFAVQKLAVSADGKTVCAATSGSGVRCQAVETFGARPVPGLAASEE